MDTTLEQLRHIRTENAKRNHDTTLMKGDMAGLSKNLPALELHVRSLVDVLSGHRDELDAMNERLVSVDQSLTELLERP
jgi:septal ring factor EnvC (AmiA/AmiB activator)